MNPTDPKHTSPAKPQPQTGDMPEEIDNQEFEIIFQNLQSTDDKIRLESVTKIKQMLYANPNLELETTINGLISKGILDTLVQIIKSTTDFDLKYQTIWTFVNICCGNSAQIGRVVEVGVVEVALGLIESAADGDPHDMHAFNLALESVWLIGNIAGDGLEHRDACLEHEAVQKMVRLLKTFPHDTKLLENTIWTMQNLVSRKPAPFWNQISEALPLFKSVLEGYKTTELQYHALWGICYISASYVKDVIQADCVPILINYLNCEQAKIVFPALQALGNLISTTNDANTDEVLKHKDFLPLLFKLCSSSNQRIQIYATWAISNIAAGTPQQIAQIVETPEYIACLSGQLSDPEDKIRYQASCALANLAFRATIEQIELLVTKHKYLDALLEVMKQDHPRIYERNIVEPINRIVTLDTTHKLKPIFKSVGLVQQLQNISNNMSYEMRTLSNEIINKHFTNIPPPQTVIPTAPSHNVPIINADGGSGAVQAQAQDEEEKKSGDTDNKHKVRKPQARVKIQKVTKDNTDEKKKKLIKRTKTMMQTIEEANKFTKGMKKGGRTRKSSKPAKKQLVPKKKKEESESTPKKGKLRRTNTMKQTLSEAKKILKQLDAQNKKKK